MAVKVCFLPQGRIIEVEEGTTILEAARASGMVVESPCNGAGTCGKCTVEIAEGHGMAAGAYPACRTEVRADLVVRLPERDGRHAMDALAEGESLAVGLAPFSKKIFDPKAGLTRVFAGDVETGVEEGDTSGRSFGLAVDIGTTTLVASLVDLAAGIEVCSVSSLNPQALHAQDVLSRIKIASTEEGLRLMHGTFTAEVNRMMEEISLRTGVPGEAVYEVVYSGNTCMLHLACSLDPSGLGRYPYTPAACGDRHVRARDLGLLLSPHALVYVPPIISGFVGADITSGILAVGLHERSGTVLFLDIGTNGEMVLRREGALFATSTAAGPAFEGMNISCGMRAGAGAVEEVIEAPCPAGEGVAVKTIGDAEASGICGSGLLDAVALLVRQGLVTREGRLLPPGGRNGDRSSGGGVRDGNGTRAFYLTDSVYVSQKDIRQVQLAKGAIRTGIEFLLNIAGVDESDIDEVLIAGAFGYHCRTGSLVEIGLLPESFLEKVRLVGNTSKSGAVAFLLNRESRRRIQEVAQGTDVIELADSPGFDRAFLRSLAFERAPGKG